jgi:rhamnogalacturonan endolyase
MGPPRAASPAGAAVDATAGVRVKVSDRYVSPHIRRRLSQLVLVLQDWCVDLIVQVEIKNGIFELTLSNPDGIVTGVRYNGVDNLMEILNKEDNRGYGTKF